MTIFFLSVSQHDQIITGPNSALALASDIKVDELKSIVTAQEEEIASVIQPSESLVNCACTQIILRPLILSIFYHCIIKSEEEVQAVQAAAENSVEGINLLCECGPRIMAQLIIFLYVPFPMIKNLHFHNYERSLMRPGLRTLSED